MIQSEFNILTIDDLEKLKFVLDSNWDIAIRWMWSPWIPWTDWTDWVDAPETQFEYSVDWTTLFHTPFVIWDLYIRESTDWGSTWSNWMKFVWIDWVGSWDVVWPASAINNNIAIFDTTTGKLIKDSGFSIATSVPGSAVFTDTTYSVWDWGLTEINFTTALSTLLWTAEQVANKWQANWYAELDWSGLVPSAQLPGYVDDVVEVADFASLPGTWETWKIYVTLDTNLTYRWSWSAYVEISASLALWETSATAYRWDRGKIAYDHSLITSWNPHWVSDALLSFTDITTNNVSTSKHWFAPKGSWVATEFLNGNWTYSAPASWWSESTQTSVTAWDNVSAGDAICYKSWTWYVKSDASDATLIDFKWFADTTVTSWNPVNLNTAGVDGNQSGLSAGDYYLSDAWFVYDTSVLISWQTTSPWGIYLWNSWTKFYVADFGNDTIYQYTLSTAYDISTATYDSKSFSVNTQESNLRDITFNGDWTKFYVIWNVADAVLQYTCSTAWDISTASYDSLSFSVLSQDTLPQWLVFKSDWTECYVTWTTNDSVYRYTLSTAWLLSSASHTSTFVLWDNPSWIAFNSTWDIMYIWNVYVDKDIQIYTLWTAWDITTATLNKTIDVSWQTIQSYWVTIWTDDKIYISSDDNDSVYQYNETAKGQISQTPGTNSVKVGEYMSTTELLIKSWGEEASWGGWGWSLVDTMTYTAETTSKSVSVTDWANKLFKIQISIQNDTASLTQLHPIINWVTTSTYTWFIAYSTTDITATTTSIYTYVDANQYMFAEYMVVWARTTNWDIAYWIESKAGWWASRWTTSWDVAIATDVTSIWFSSVNNITWTVKIYEQTIT